MGLGFPQTWFPCMSDNRKEGFFFEEEKIVSFPRVSYESGKTQLLSARVMTAIAHAFVFHWPRTARRESCFLAWITASVNLEYDGESRLCLSRRCHAELTDSQSQVEEFAWDATCKGTEFTFCTCLCRETTHRNGKILISSNLPLICVLGFSAWIMHATFSWSWKRMWI